jgi:Rab GDP dissociation inhibitor
MTAEQVAQRELAVALPYMQPTKDVFYDLCDIEFPTDDGRESNVFVSKSYDATSHFQTAVDDVLDMYRRIMGKDLVLTDGPKRGE